MTLQTIDTAEPNFPVNLFTPEEDTVETSDSDWLVLTCCGYAHVPYTIDPIREPYIDE